MISKLKNQKILKLGSWWSFTGFTLLELLVALTIMSLVMALSASTFTVATEAHKTALATVDIYEKGRAVLDLISRDLQTAYLSEISRSKEMLFDSDNPQPLFVGINLWQDVGDGIDNDGDGLIDEEWLDGINNDLDSDANGYDQIDERDYGYVPRDLLFFASAQDNRGMGDIMEIGYTVESAIDDEKRKTYTSGRYDMLMRYSAVYADEAYPLDYAVPETNFLVPANIPGESFDPVAYGIMGINFTYYYYDYYKIKNEENDYVERGWRKLLEWYSSAESSGEDITDKVFFPDFGKNHVLNNFYPGGYYNTDPMYLTEINDSENQDNISLFNTVWYPMCNELVDQEYFDDKYIEKREVVRDNRRLRSDGLPFMVEVTIWIDDDDEYLSTKNLPPKMLQTRVFLQQE